MAIERVLTERIGPAGARLHTGRSRNDQVATDTRLYAKAPRRRSRVPRLSACAASLVRLAEEHLGVVMPGYTHLQKAQPVLFSHHLLAYAWMLTRDFTRCATPTRPPTCCRSGSAALAGTTYPLDREYVAERLGFSAVSANSMDAVSDRDFLLDLVYACAVCQVHLSRLAEELILWSSDEFGFVTMDDEFSTGSSIMPQKKNPDFAELVRGKTGRVFGDLHVAARHAQGSSARLQQGHAGGQGGRVRRHRHARRLAARDERHARHACTSTRTACARARSGGFMAATDLADYLVGKGVPFREAHEVVGRLVLCARARGPHAAGPHAAEYRDHAKEFGPDVLAAVDIDQVVAAPHQCRRHGPRGGRDPARRRWARRWPQTMRG